jgi:hypothetical protein
LHEFQGLLGPLVDIRSDSKNSVMERNTSRT